MGLGVKSTGAVTTKGVEVGRVSLGGEAWNKFFAAWTAFPNNPRVFGEEVDGGSGTFFPMLYGVDAARG